MHLQYHLLRRADEAERKLGRRILSNLTKLLSQISTQRDAEHHSGRNYGCALSFLPQARPRRSVVEESIKKAY